MKRSLVVGSLGALGILAALASHACACSCAPTDFYAAFAGSNAVLLGEVLEISSPAPEHPDQVSVTVRVEYAWKGASATSTIQVLTASSSAACGFSFRVGARYLIYANDSVDSPAPGELWASLCSRTHETWPGDPDLDLLKSPLPPLIVTVMPNPSASSVRLAWTILGDSGQRATARLEVLDLQGRRIRTLVDGPAAAGPHASYWDGRDEHGRPARAGIYLVRLAHADRVVVRRLVRMATQP
jgi:FlgD Ig-like domain